MRSMVLIFTFLLSSCASVQLPGYINKADHPYERKYYASFEKLVSSMIYVLRNKGWTISSEADPAIYERDERYENSGYQNLLLITDTKKNYRVLYSSYTHLNIFIHSMAKTCDVEIRYEAQTPLIKQFISTRNDRMVQGILDAVEQEINRQ